MSNAHSASTRLASEYFDGQRAQPHPVTLRIDGLDLVIEGEGLTRRVPRRQIRWPQRQRAGARLTYLPNHGLIQHADGPGWDAWAGGLGLREPLLAGWLRGWRGLALVLVFCVGLTVGAWQWGVPWAGQAVVSMIPPSVDASLGEQSLKSFDDEGLAKTALSEERQAAIRQALATAVERTYAPAERPTYTLNFRASGEKKIGPNAFALPGGQMVLTDELVTLLADEPDLITGVLAHELGHVRHRHGLRTTAQTSLLAVLVGVVVGDFSSVVTVVSAALSQQAYARDFEREADQEAIRVLRANGIAPSRMVRLFDKLDEWRRQQDKGAVHDLPIALADHPTDEERRQVFRAADQAR